MQNSGFTKVKLGEIDVRPAIATIQLQNKLVLFVISRKTFEFDHIHGSVRLKLTMLILFRLRIDYSIIYKH